MPIEIELKARIADRTRIERVLSRIGTFQRRFDKSDRYFGPAGSAEPLFRLRSDDNGLVCTFKEKRIDDLFEENLETEFPVPDADLFERFIRFLGFECVVAKRKIGMSWLVGAIQCELSDVNDLGTFLELEIILPDDARSDERSRARGDLHSLLTDLEIDESHIETRPYTRMINENVSRRDDVPCSPV
jgi:adenylate cyclase class 2